MARPLRIEFAGALYHVTSRGDGQEDIYLDDSDRRIYIEVLKEVCTRFNWVVHAYCLMTNHYHILIETPESNLAKGMRHLNGVYTQRFNKKNKRVGHVFQGRYKAILVDKEAYLLELARYIVLNPVRARMVRAAKDWPWSSYRATAGFKNTDTWLTVDWILSVFSKKRAEAIKQYRLFVSEGRNQPAPWDELQNQIFLGNDAFVDEMQCKISVNQSLDDIPSSQKQQVAKPLMHYEKRYEDRDEAIFNSYKSGGYSMKEIGDYFGLHYSRISRILKAKDNT
ncbi:MAG: REP-associated tyrosine transposase [Arenicellales bacterium]